MRAVLVRPGPNFSVEDVADGWLRAFTQLGVEVRSFDLGGAMTFYERALHAAGVDVTGQDAARWAAKDLRALLYDWWPQFVFIVSSFYLPPDCYEVIRGRGHQIVTLFTESPYEDDNQLLIAPYSDVCLINDPQNLDRFIAQNPRSRYSPHAYDPTRHYPQPAQDQYRSDLCFVGTGYPSRMAFFEACDLDGLDVALAGNWIDLEPDSPLRKYLAHPEDGVCCPNEETALLYASTRSSLNIYRTEAQHQALAQGWAMSPREVELAACGTFYLTEERGENRAVLPMIPTFQGPADFTEKLRWWLDHDEARRRVTQAARSAIADRTFTHQARDLLASL